MEHAHPEMAIGPIGPESKNCFQGSPLPVQLGAGAAEIIHPRRRFARQGEIDRDEPSLHPGVREALNDQDQLTAMVATPTSVQPSLAMGGIETGPESVASSVASPIRQRLAMRMIAGMPTPGTCGPKSLRLLNPRARTPKTAPRIRPRSWTSLAAINDRRISRATPNPKTSSRAPPPPPLR